MVHHHTSPGTLRVEGFCEDQEEERRAPGIALGPRRGGAGRSRGHGASIGHHLHSAATRHRGRMVPGCRSFRVFRFRERSLGLRRFQVARRLDYVGRGCQGLELRLPITVQGSRELPGHCGPRKKVEQRLRQYRQRPVCHRHARLQEKLPLYSRHVVSRYVGSGWPTTGGGTTGGPTTGSRFTPGHTTITLSFRVSGAGNFSNQYALFQFQVGGNTLYGWLELSKLSVHNLGAERHLGRPRRRHQRRPDPVRRYRRPRAFHHGTHRPRRLGLDARACAAGAPRVNPRRERPSTPVKPSLWKRTTVRYFSGP